MTPMWAVLAKELSSVSSAHRLLGTTCDPGSGDEASSGQAPVSQAHNALSNTKC